MSSKKFLNRSSYLASMLIVTVLITAPLHPTFAQSAEVFQEDTAGNETAPAEEALQSEEAETVESSESKEVATSPDGADTETSIMEEGGSEPQLDGEEVSEEDAGADPVLPQDEGTGPEMDTEATLDTNGMGTPTLSVGNEDEGVDLLQGSSEGQEATTTDMIGDEQPQDQGDESVVSTAGPGETSTVAVEALTTSSTSTSPSLSTSTAPLEEATTSDAVLATGTPTIVTGDSVALANVLNLVNTNFVNSEGVIVFDNFFETLFGDLDLRDMYDSLATFGCSLISCPQNDVTTNISSEATINNALVIEALTGRNVIEGGETATIDTGDAYAGLNLINVANTNVIDSNYLLVTMNAFKDVEGDIVFPSLSNFFNRVAGGASLDKLTISNAANVVNNVAVSAESGSNSAEGGSSSVHTGGSTASTNVFNQLNTSLAGGQSVSIIFRVHGDWAGEIFGAPSNLAWTEDGQGGLFLFDTANGLSGGDNLTINATNSASIHNDVSVVALTGENAITGAETALISTGNAYAGANIVNVANATVVGRNWILAIINILGDFTGNISFGRPDLWIGAQVDVPNTIQNESLLTYKFTVINNGDAPASSVRLTDDYDESYIDIIRASVPFSVDGAGKVFWDIGELLPGMATEITYDARVKGTSYSTDITNMLSVTERESDNNRLDNSDTITVTTDGRPQRNGSGVRISLERSPGTGAETDALHALDIDRLTASTTLSGGDRESIQELVLTNTTSKTIRSVVLHDTLTDPAGVTVRDEAWELGDVLPHEEITISYKVSFSPNASVGRYLLSTRVEDTGTRPLVENENGHITIVDSVSPEPHTEYEDGAVPQILGIAVTREEKAEETARSILPFVIPTAQAATRVDHGLPMTHVPYRYSLYFFILAIVMINIYYMIRKTKSSESDE